MRCAQLKIEGSQHAKLQSADLVEDKKGNYSDKPSSERMAFRRDSLNVAKAA